MNELEVVDRVELYGKRSECINISLLQDRMACLLYTSTIPSLLLLGFGHSFVAGVGAGLLFGIGYGIFDANNMPILCQFVSSKHRDTAYGIMNMTGVFAGAAITEVLGKWTDGGKLGLGFATVSYTHL